MCECMRREVGVGPATRELRKSSSWLKLLTQCVLFSHKLGIYSLFFYARSSLFPSFGDGGEELRFLNSVFSKLLKKIRAFTDKYLI